MVKLTCVQLYKSLHCISNLFMHHPGCMDTEIPSHNFDPFLLDAEFFDKCIKYMKLGKANGPDDLTVVNMLYAHIGYAFMLFL